MPNCPRCNSSWIQKDGNHNGMQRYKCMSCSKRFDFRKYGQKKEYFFHFNTKLEKKENNFLTRDNYYVKTDKIVDKNHLENCMKNYELNMEFFSKIDHKEFDKYLARFITKYNFRETKDLSELSFKKGIYILVLDKYNQVYIGKSNNMKKEIMKYWSKKISCDRLLYGDTYSSVLSISSFGALDTTRIFYKELKWYKDIDESEELYIKSFKNEYSLNRVDGGINGEECSSIRNLKLLASRKTRNFNKTEDK